MSYDTTFAVKCENKVIEQSLLGPRLPRRFLAANRVNRNRGRQYQVEVLLRILSQYRGRSAGKHECSRIVATHSHNYEVSAMPCSESEVERRPSAALQKPCCTKPRSASQAMEIWLSCCRWGLGSCRVGTRREALYAGEAAFRWRGSSGGRGISDHVARGQDAMSVSRLCDTVAGAFSSACRY
jgi:hypothetical protein